MSPELIEGKPYKGADADLFAVGFILFNLYTGYPPFECAQSTDRLYKFLHFG